MADDSGIDPRYAAQFQRGFDPARHQAAPVATPPRDPAAPVRLPGGPAKNAERVPDRPAAASAVPPPPLQPQSETVDAPEALVDTVQSTARRWEEWILPAFAALLTASAIWFLQESLTEREMMFGTPDPVEAAWLQIRATLPGPLLAGAAVASTAWLVLKAVRGSRL